MACLPYRGAQSPLTSPNKGGESYIVGFSRMNIVTHKGSLPNNEPSLKGNPIIVLHDISKVYYAGEVSIHALSHIEITITRGEFVAIIGQSGSGKTTLLDILGCLSRPTGGEYWLDGQNVGLLSDEDLTRIRNQKIGFVFQTFNLLPRSDLLHNVELPLIYGNVPAAKRKKMAAAAIEKVGLSDRIKHKPNELSGGQRQRVAIARALVNNPSIILADEPTGNLDTATGEEIMAVFEQLYKAGNTIVLVTHETEIAERTHRIVRLRDGLIESDEVTNNGAH